MSYEPTNWKSGDVVTSAKLNKLENGVANAGGATIVRAVMTGQGNGTMDMTAGEIMAAAEVGPVILLETVTGYGTIAAGPVSIYTVQGGAFYIEGISPNVSMYSAASADDYPSSSI